jgi:hypothetical protein
MFYARRFLMPTIVPVLALCLAAPSASAQSQAINGTIEGTLTDTTGAVLPGVTVTVTNAETGAQRVIISASDGSYRALLLPLGTYRVRAALAGFKTIERSGLAISAGDSARVDLQLEVGGINEIISVNADAPITDPSKIDLGRTISANEIENLPLVARNPYNFALQQPNVVGYENEEFGATRMNANGTQMRTNYQIDGSNATQKNRAGLRMFQPSEVMIEEVKVTTSGFAPEFGQTTGMVFNAITPSGTNTFSGQASYRLRRQWLSARPATLGASAPKPDTNVDNITAALGGPIIRDKWHFYLGYEWLEKDLSADRVITVSPSDAALLGLSAAALGDGVIPAVQKVNMFIAKTDAQLGDANRLSLRWSAFQNSTPENIGGGLNTREIALDFQDRMDAAQLQLVTTIGSNKLNELRVAFGKRDNPRQSSAVAGPGPTVEIPGVANFGGSDTRTSFVEKYWQVVDNVSWFAGRHSFKAGVDFQFVTDTRLSDISATYRFDSIDAYIAARDGVDGRGYASFQQNIGDPAVDYQQQYYSFFVQDDFRLTSNLKLLYGLRYDMFVPPSGNANAPAEETRSFGTDRNNFAPRVGVVWALDPQARTVLRASTGLMYEPALGIIYEDALLEAGLPTFLSASVSPDSAGSPTYPATLATVPPESAPSRSIRTVSSAYDNQYSWMTNVQLERALTEDMSLAAGYVNAMGRSLPVSLSNNFLPSGDVLADGRPILDRNQRARPEFETVREVRSTGDSQYSAFTLLLEKRMSQGYQFQASYTWARAQDHGLSGRFVVGSIDREGLSDPTNQEFDYGPTAWDQTHTFIFSTVIAPIVEGRGLWADLAKNNQLGLIVQANSGLPFNIRSNLDLNNDGFTNDRPNGVGRNSRSLGGVFNIDARYSRFFSVKAHARLEIFVEAKNLLNSANVRSVNSVVQTDELGNLIDGLPGTFPITQTYESRQVQFGARFTF